jgi:prepilin-type N-terminal cleavage/methylation domain-containing protein
MHKKLAAFTLIELLVVIVILGILSTISVGTFRSYFAKARDAERVSAVQNLAMMIKVDSGGRGDCTVYNYTDDDDCPAASADNLAKLALENDYKLPSIRNGLNYYYVFLPGITEGDNNFFVAVGAEEDNAENGVSVLDPFSIFVDGTLLGIQTAPNCTWEEGNLVSCLNTADGGIWEIMPLSDVGGGNGMACSPTNCGGCTTMISCSTATCTFSTDGGVFECS